MDSFTMLMFLYLHYNMVNYLLISRIRGPLLALDNIFLGLFLDIILSLDLPSLVHMGCWVVNIR